MGRKLVMKVVSLTRVFRNKGDICLTIVNKIVTIWRGTSRQSRVTNRTAPLNDTTQDHLSPRKKKCQNTLSGLVLGEVFLYFSVVLPWPPKFLSSQTTVCVLFQNKRAVLSYYGKFQRGRGRMGGRFQ